MPLSSTFLKDRSGSFTISVFPKEFLSGFLEGFEVQMICFSSISCILLCISKTSTPNMRAKWKSLVCLHGRRVNEHPLGAAASPQIPQSAAPTLHWERTRGHGFSAKPQPEMVLGKQRNQD